jgi:hypothetical protein
MIKSMKCTSCGKEIQNPYYINGKAYGYNCYKQKLALIYKQFEDEKNQEYARKCFSAMEIFTNKKSNTFHDSIVNQWNDCKKLTAKQLECIIKGFTATETIEFYKTWFTLTEDEGIKRSMFSWIEKLLNNDFTNYIEDEIIHNIIKDGIFRKIKSFYFYRDLIDINDNRIFLSYSFKNLEEDSQDDTMQIIKIVE